MSDLRPAEGIKAIIGGVEFHFLFTFAAIDELQEYYGEPLSEVVKRLTDNMTAYSAAGHIIEALIRSDLYNNGERDTEAPSYADIMHVLNMRDAQRITRALLEAYGVSMPEPDEEDEADEEEEKEDGETMNLARLLVIARTQLQLQESEFWKATPRKFFRLLDEYIYLKGGKKQEEGGIDALP